MFCRFCGKEIQNDSVFCAFCGKEQDLNDYNNEKEKKDKGSSLHLFSKTVTPCFYIGLIVFLVLLWKMAPGIGKEHYYSYAVCAGITLVVAWGIHGICRRKPGLKSKLMMLCFGLLLLLPSLALRIIYEYKVDDALMDFPKQGKVSLEIRLQEEFYSYSHTGKVRNPYSYIVVDGDRVGNNEIISIELNKTYPVQVNAGYEGEVGITSSASSGNTDRRITFTRSNLKNGYKITPQVELKDGYAIVTVRFRRVCLFWETIFYKKELD